MRCGAVVQFAVVNNILTSKVLPARVGYLIDDFCAFTITATWVLSNALFWPLLNTPLELLVGALEIGFFSLNVIRTYWNWKHEKLGIGASGKASASTLDTHSSIRRRSDTESLPCSAAVAASSFSLSHCLLLCFLSSSSFVCSLIAWLKLRYAQVKARVKAGGRAPPTVRVPIEELEQD